MAIAQEMPVRNYDWSGKHDLLRTRAQAEAIFTELGYEFAEAGTPAKLERTQRPRLIGLLPAHQARLELIGPDEAIFKATLAVPANGEQAEPLRAFLAAWIPTWAEGSTWLAANVTRDGVQQPAETKFRELTISLRPGHRGTQTILNVSWEGAG
jgi:hypothetical protein